MQEFIVKHSGTHLPLASATAFPGLGDVLPSSTPFAIESFFTALPVSAGTYSLAFVAKSANPADSSRIDHMVSSAGNIAIPPDGCYLYYFRTELPEATAPGTITWATLATGTNTQVQPLHSIGSYKTLSWRDCVPMSFLNSSVTAGNAVFYGLVLRFIDVAAAAAISGSVSCREVLVDRSVLQPLK